METPDLVALLRYSPRWGQFQIAAVVCEIDFQETGMPVRTHIASGLNFAGALFATESDKVYYQVLFGEGVGSYRELPDAAPSAVDGLAMVGSFGWMLGWTHDWSESFSSNFTYMSLQENGPHRPTAMNWPRLSDRRWMTRNCASAYLAYCKDGKTRKIPQSRAPKRRNECRFAICPKW